MCDKRCASTFHAFVCSLAIAGAADVDSNATGWSKAPLGHADLVRARAPRPHPRSRVAGDTAAEAFTSMNAVLSGGGARVRHCDAFNHTDLNALARRLYEVRSPELDDLYAAANDKRALHFRSLDYKERLWAAEAQMATTLVGGAEASEHYNATRDGKCAEVVMWYTHHLSQSQRDLLHRFDDFVLPLMPRTVAPVGVGGHEYALQIKCTDCHVAVQQRGKPPIRPVPQRNGTGPQYPTTCNASGKQTPVWYNRTKRCDWDYEPFCQPCEGVGGLIWGPGETEWRAMECEPLQKPHEIPTDNLTNPLWPKYFTVQEYADLTFPGRDPCKINFHNSTYTLHFDTRPDGPIYHTVGHTGHAGPLPIPAKSWALPDGNFYNSITFGNLNAFCICISPIDPIQHNALTGPLRYDFLDTAKLIGRERIFPEYHYGPLVADHWVKGPHHFWIDVATNRMVREWQPFNGHQIYYDWNLTRPDANIMDVPEMCYKGLRHVNISCEAPPPTRSNPAVLVV